MRTASGYHSRMSHTIAATAALLAQGGATARPLWLIREGELAAFKASQPAAVAAWLEQSGFNAERHRVLLLPGEGGTVAGAVAGVGALEDWDRLTLCLTGR